MGKRSRTKNEAPAGAMPAPMPVSGLNPGAVETIDRFMNSFAEAVGLGGGVNPVGYPFSQYVPGSATVENVGTIFKNLRWYLISNMRQVLNQAYVEFGLVQTIVDVPVDDGLRGGIQIKSAQLEESQIEELKTSLDRDDDLNTVGQAAKWNRLFGGAGILILTDQDPVEPFEPDQLGENDPLEFRAVDMWELFWDKQNTEGYDPTIQEESFEYYNYYGEQVHKSRVIRLKGLTAPSFIRPRLRGWGFSVVEILVRSINQYLKSTDLAFEVLDEFKVDVYKIAGLTQALASPVGIEQIKKRVQLANWEKNYNNALTMDKEDDWDHKQLSFAGLGDAMMQIRMQVAADMRMPLTKLFGVSAAGFNSGEDDIEVYNAMVESQVRNKIKYPVLRVLEIKCQKLFGYIPDDLSITFEPLRVMSSEQEQTVKTQKFTRLQQALTTGAITLKEFRDACNKGELFDVTLDTSNDDLLTGYMADQVTDEGTDPDEDVEGDDNPGASRVDTARPTAGSRGGVPTESPVKGKTAAKDQDRAKEAKPPKDAPTKPPRRGDKAVNPGRVRNDGLIILPKPFTRAERAKRAVANSATFDRKSYEADGGDGWIDSRRKHFFDRDKAQDKGLWDRAVAASRDALGAERWQFVVWFYKKYGGGFSQLGA
jgi:phage-related protein (TIGR01555 family)